VTTLTLHLAGILFKLYSPISSLYYLVYNLPIKGKPGTIAILLYYAYGCVNNANNVNNVKGINVYAKIITDNLFTQMVNVYLIFYQSINYMHCFMFI